MTIDQKILIWFFKNFVSTEEFILFIKCHNYSNIILSHDQHNLISDTFECPPPALIFTHQVDSCHPALQVSG